MLVNRKNDIFPPISTIILPKVLTLCYPVHLETLAVFIQNTCVALNIKAKKTIGVCISAIQNHGCNVGKQKSKTFAFQLSNKFKGNIAYFTSNTIVAADSTSQSSSYGQNVVNLILPVSGLGSARVNTSPPVQNGRHFRRQHFQMHFCE